MPSPRCLATHITCFVRCNREVRADDLKLIKDIATLLQVQADAPKA